MSHLSDKLFWIQKDKTVSDGKAPRPPVCLTHRSVDWLCSHAQGLVKGELRWGFEKEPSTGCSRSDFEIAKGCLWFFASSPFDLLPPLNFTLQWP